MTKRHDRNARNMCADIWIYRVTAIKISRMCSLSSDLKKQNVTGKNFRNETCVSFFSTTFIRNVFVEINI